MQFMLLEIITNSNQNNYENTKQFSNTLLNILQIHCKLVLWKLNGIINKYKAVLITLTNETQII